MINKEDNDRLLHQLQVQARANDVRAHGLEVKANAMSARNALLRGEINELRAGRLLHMKQSSFPKSPVANFSPKPHSQTAQTLVHNLLHPHVALIFFLRARASFYVR